MIGSVVNSINLAVINRTLFGPPYLFWLNELYLDRADSLKEAACSGLNHAQGVGGMVLLDLLSGCYIQSPNKYNLIEYDDESSTKS